MSRSELSIRDLSPCALIDTFLKLKKVRFATITVAPDPDREGKEHDPDGGDVGEAVEEHQILLAKTNKV